ncbi:MAG: hypothetical protein JF588_21960 [Caulobacterales bacterium]|nr:hypothetical protein [Caulobacterales bacterium]
MAYDLGSLVALQGGGYVSLAITGGSGQSTLSYQLYDAGRAPVGAPVTIEQVTDFGLTGTSFTGHPNLIALAGGGFAVGWAENFHGRFGSGSSTVAATLYDARGAVTGHFVDQVQSDPLGGIQAADPQLIALSNHGVAILDQHVASDAQSSGGYVTVLDAAGQVVTQTKAGVTFDYAANVDRFVELVGLDQAGLPAQQLIGYAGESGTLGPIATQAGTGAADTLSGSDGSESLSGGAGDDLINGHGGYDVYSSGAGADTFVFVTGHGAVGVTDFDASADRLVVQDGLGVVQNLLGSVLAFNRATGELSWEPNGDPGIGGKVLGNLPGVQGLTTANLATGFQPTYLRTINLDGSRDDVRTDLANTEAFTTVTASYNSAGQMIRYAVVNDDASHWQRVFDAANSQEWSSTVAEYDSRGGLFAYTVLHDDGSRTLWQFDSGNTHTWSRELEEYDAQGRLTQQSAAMDDGTAFERHIDAADTQPWAYYIDNYANGALVSHTFYNADGSVFH